MLNRKPEQAARARRRGRPLGLCVCAVATVTLAAVFAAMAPASGSTAPTLIAATNAEFSEGIVTDAHGRTLYALSPETTHHLLCKSRECLKVWPPITVRSRGIKLVVGSGVHGHLGILRRSNGMLQVTLDGRPIYHFSGDPATGASKGENIHSFGGTWHVLSALTGAPLQPAVSTPAPATPSEPYGY